MKPFVACIIITIMAFSGCGTPSSADAKAEEEVVNSENNLKSTQSSPSEEAVIQASDDESSNVDGGTIDTSTASSSQSGEKTEAMEENGTIVYIDPNLTPAENPYILKFRTYTSMSPVVTYGLDIPYGYLFFSYQEQLLADYRAANLYRKDIHCYDLIDQTLKTHFKEGGYDAQNLGRYAGRPHGWGAMNRDDGGAFHMLRQTRDPSRYYFANITHRYPDGNGWREEEVNASKPIGSSTHLHLFANENGAVCADFDFKSYYCKEANSTQWRNMGRRAPFPELFDGYISRSHFYDSQDMVVIEMDIRYIQDGCHAAETNASARFHHINPFDDTRTVLHEDFRLEELVDRKNCSLPASPTFVFYAYPLYEEGRLLSDAFVFETRYNYSRLGENGENKDVDEPMFHKVAFKGGQWQVGTLPHLFGYENDTNISAHYGAFEDPRLAFPFRKKGAVEPEYLILENGEVTTATFAQLTGVPYQRYWKARAYYGFEWDRIEGAELFSYLTKEGKLHLLRHDDSCAGVTAEYVDGQGYKLEGNFTRTFSHLIVDLTQEDYRTPEFEEIVDVIPW